MIPSTLLVLVLAAPSQNAVNPHSERAKAAFDDERWAEAASAFADAYAHDPHSLYLYGRAQALRFGGECREAIDMYVDFIAAQPSPPLDAIEGAIANLAWCREQLPAPVDKVPVVPAPSLPPKPPSLPSEVAPAPRRAILDPWGAALSVSGIALAGTGGILALSARSGRIRADAAPNEQQYLSAIDDASAKSRAAGALLSVGGALLLGGVIRYAWVSVRNHRRTSRHETALVGPRFEVPVFVW